LPYAWRCLMAVAGFPEHVLQKPPQRRGEARGQPLGGPLPGLPGVTQEALAEDDPCLAAATGPPPEQPRQSCSATYQQSLDRLLPVKAVSFVHRLRGTAGRDAPGVRPRWATRRRFWKNAELLTNAAAILEKRGTVDQRGRDFGKTRNC
jgi:hypothetical protein